MHCLYTADILSLHIGFLRKQLVWSSSTVKEISESRAEKVTTLDWEYSRAQILLIRLQNFEFIDI